MVDVDEEQRSGARPDEGAGGIDLDGPGPERVERERVDVHVPPLARRLGTLAAAAAAAFVVITLALVAISEYRVMEDFVSELVLGRAGWLLPVALVQLALGIVGLAVAVWRVLSPAARGIAAVGVALLAVAVLGTLTAAVLPISDVDSAGELHPDTWTARTHLTASLVAFLATIAAMLVLAQGFSRVRQLARLSMPSNGCAVAAGALLVANPPVEYLGLAQRGMLYTLMAWFAIVGLGIARAEED